MNCSKGIHDRGDDFMDFKPEVLLHIEGIDPLVSEVFLKAMHLQGMQGKLMMRDLKNINMHPGQAICCQVIAGMPGLSQRELADRIHIQPATAAIMLQKMEKAGLIRREPDSEDQRISRIYITEHGSAANGEASQVFREFSMNTLGKLTKEQLQEYSSLIDRLLILTAEYTKKQILEEK